LLVLVTASPARADDDKAVAREAYQKGSRYYDLRQYAEALDAFKRAYLNYEEPAFLFNIAQCHRALGHRDEALQFYRSYLRKLPNAPNRDEVRRIIATLEATPAPKPEPVVTPPPPKPEPVVKPPPPKLTPAPVVVTPATETTIARKPQKKSVARSWWLWTVVGVVAAGAATGIAVGVTQGTRTETSLDPVHVP
jgi:tetratricopeptide (TPR) repeat protein